MRIFISGPIAKAPRSKIERFDAAKQYLENAGHEVVTELEIPYPDFDGWVNNILSRSDKDETVVREFVLAIKKAIELLLGNCDGILLLPGWKGCYVCLFLCLAALMLGMVVYIDDGSAIKPNDDGDLRDWFENQMDGLNN